MFHGKKIVVGVGMIPSLPETIDGLEHPFIFHSSDYLFHKKSLLTKKNISLIGSGQSAAEIFYDLLQHAEQFESITWFTLSEYVFPMDSSKFAFEMTSPEYIDYFYDLPDPVKGKIQARQNRLYKGESKELIDSIYERLYLDEIHGSRNNIKIYINTEFDQLNIGTNSDLNLQFLSHNQRAFFRTQNRGGHFCDRIQEHTIPEFLGPISHLIFWNENAFYDVNKNYSVDYNNSIFVQNADLHSHGFNSADLGMGPYRNAIILNEVLERKYFNMESHIVFQHFGVPRDNL